MKISVDWWSFSPWGGEESFCLQKFFLNWESFTNDHEICSSMICMIFRFYEFLYLVSQFFAQNILFMFLAKPLCWRMIDPDFQCRNKFSYNKMISIDNTIIYRYLYRFDTISLLEQILIPTKKIRLRRLFSGSIGTATIDWITGNSATWSIWGWWCVGNFDHFDPHVQLNF